jgi:hypothetical protein
VTVPIVHRPCDDKRFHPHPTLPQRERGSIFSSVLSPQERGNK